MHIAPDDIVAGMAVIVESARSEINSFSSPSSDDFHAYHDMQWMQQYGGKPCEVASVSLPFVALRVFAGDSGGSGMMRYMRSESPSKVGELHSVDVRKFNFVRCDQAMLQTFVVAALPQTVVDLTSVFGNRIAKRLEKIGMRRIEDVIHCYRYRDLRDFSGMGDVTMRKIDNVMAMLGVSRNGF